MIRALLTPAAMLAALFADAVLGPPDWPDTRPRTSNG